MVKEGHNLRKVKKIREVCISLISVIWWMESIFNLVWLSAACVLSLITFKTYTGCNKHSEMRAIFASVGRLVSRQADNVCQTEKQA